MLYRQQQNWFIASTTQPVKPGEGKLKTDDMEVRVDPLAEWNQMYREVWRLERDFFYDPNHHGLDLKATEKKYEPYLKSLAHRSDLNYLFGEMLGELTVGHLYIGGGDAPEAKRVPGGLLGCDFSIENGRYRFARVFNGENWNPSLRAPLTQPGVNVQAGEYLLAVNGRDVSASENVYSRFENTADKSVVLKVGPNADGSDSREVTVVPVPSEANLRYLAWIEGNRRKVDAMSGGKLAYVHLPDTASGGFTNFNRYYFAQIDKDGAVIDERFNGGGSAADYIVDALKKPVLSYWAGARGHGRDDAGRRAAGAEGDDHQRVRRFGRRLDAVDVPADEDRAARREADVGRAGRHRRLPDARGRRIRHRPALRLLQPGEPVGGGEPRRRP